MAKTPDRFANFTKQLAKYEPQVHHLNPPATEEAISSAESALGVSFPPAYREFLRRWNGGVLFGTFVPIFAIHGAKVNPKKFMADDLVSRNKPNKRWPGTPDDYIAIAANSSGDTFNLDLKAGSEAPVVQWDHESAKPARKWKNFVAWLDAQMKDGSKIYGYDGEVL